ncbi:hypothetical protein BP6252_09240 [Coleophoma cylindrospora]|uniref:EF-hand domain-containing protein n=1 Tax=Coleophoma cylindrospora TaxID=1849047 RepID=A0A3D8R1Z1_9HELO|nr:hypothetical protein BP6252_09240 [Coleophoma cylindrospora]
MAYNKTFNPDSLPAFAEPERKHNDSPSQRPPTSSQYSNKPAPPLPNTHAQPAMGRLSPQVPPPQNYGYSSHASPTSHGYNSPPGGNYGAPRPQPQQHRPQPVSRPPPSPAPGDHRDPALLPLFKAVDKDRSGTLSERELSAALVNGDWSSFDPHTVKMMIRMFDSDRSGTINFDEFCGLWGFLAAWRGLFDRFDVDKSGSISLDEFTNALAAFGYRLSQQFVVILFRTFDKRNEGAISFDLFVQSCISLKRMTDVFKKYDDDRDGFITLSL